MFNGLLKNATKIVAIAALAATLVYTLLLLFLPATMYVVSGPFQVPEGTVDPYLSKAITLTFGFLATWLITKYMLGWNALNKKIAAFAGIVGVWILYYFMMWWVTTAEPRKKMSELQEQIQTQQAQIAQFQEAAVQKKERSDEIQREDVAGGHTEEKHASVVSALPRWVGTALGVMLGLFVGIVLIPFAGFRTAEKIVGHDDPGFGFLLTAVFYIGIAVVACATWGIVG